LTVDSWQWDQNNKKKGRVNCNRVAWRPTPDIPDPKPAVEFPTTSGEKNCIITIGFAKLGNSLHPSTDSTRGELARVARRDRDPTIVIISEFPDPDPDRVWLGMRRDDDDDSVLTSTVAFFWQLAPPQVAQTITKTSWILIYGLHIRRYSINDVSATSALV
jgi:hypothetical protein